MFHFISKTARSWFRPVSEDTGSAVLQRDRFMIQQSLKPLLRGDARPGGTDPGRCTTNHGVCSRGEKQYRGVSGSECGYANPNMQQVEREISRPAASQGDGLDLQKLFTQLQQNPEVLGQLAALLKSV